MLEEKEEKVNQSLIVYQKLLDTPENKKYLEIADKIMPNSNFKKARKEMDIKISKDKIKSQIKDLSKEFKKKVLTREEINEDCLRYNLNFIQSTNYEGNFDIDYVKKISDFLESNSFLISEYEYEKKIYFLVPEDTKGVKNPMAFFKYEDYYIMIDNNKNYATPFRLFKGFADYSRFNKSILWSAITTSLSAILLFFLLHYCDEDVHGFILSIICDISVFLIIVFQIVFYCFRDWDQRKSDRNQKVENTFNYLYVFLGLITLYSFYFGLSILYTFEPKYKVEIQKETVKFTEAKELGYKVEPNKKYFVNDTIEKEIIGHWFYFTVNTKHKKQDKNESINNY